VCASVTAASPVIGFCFYISTLIRTGR
jgi:hypothetical protein